MPTVEGAGVELAYEDTGTDPPTTLVIHGMASGASASAALRAALPGRVIAHDRRGYGGSGAPEPYAATTVQEQGEDAAALLGAVAAAPVRVVGFGFGALIALDLLVRRAELVVSAVLCDAPLLAFVPEANESLSAQRQQLEDALREGGPPAAIERWLGPDASAEELARGPGLAARLLRRLRGAGDVVAEPARAARRSPYRSSSSPARAAGRTSPRRRTRRPGWCRERPGAPTATSSRLWQATDYTAEPVPASHRRAPLR